ncbi:MAG TPA: helix-turn-helix transcriptional regulator [Solirubrobacteraceae bacterium]|nr:helix-turn-helix transcriptional regulator [Solirubrobacteraceae bacterium]
MTDPADDADDTARDQAILGAAIRALRERAGLTQEQFGERAGMDATYLSQLENGHRGIRWATVMRMLRALNLDLTDLAEEYPRHAD